MITGRTQAQKDAASKLVQLGSLVAKNQEYLDSTDWHVSYSVETGNPIDPTVKQNRANARAAITQAQQQIAALPA